MSFASAEAESCGGRGDAFDEIVLLSEAENATSFAKMPEFVAFRTFQTATKLQSRLKKFWCL